MRRRSRGDRNERYGRTKVGRQWYDLSETISVVELQNGRKHFSHFTF